MYLLFKHLCWFSISKSHSRIKWQAVLFKNTFPLLKKKKPFGFDLQLWQNFNSIIVYHLMGVQRDLLPWLLFPDRISEWTWRASHTLQCCSWLCNKMEALSVNPICILQRGRVEHQFTAARTTGGTQDPNAFMDFFREAILNKTTMSSISCCKAVSGSGQILVNGKGHGKVKGRLRYGVLLEFSLRWFSCKCTKTTALNPQINEQIHTYIAIIYFRGDTDCIKRLSSTITAASNIWSTPNGSTQSRSLMTVDQVLSGP